MIDVHILVQVNLVLYLHGISPLYRFWELNKRTITTLTRTRLLSLATFAVKRRHWGSLLPLVRLIAFPACYPGQIWRRVFLAELLAHQE